jgi:divalent metal cation (Fe/Co/Zn/Cd) transporter
MVSDNESDATVLLAGTANLAIAIAKLVAGLLSGSTALLAEAAGHPARDPRDHRFRGGHRLGAGVLSLRLSPEQVLVVARVDLDDSETTGAAVEQLAERIDRSVQAAFPMVRHLYLDPTPADVRQRLS